MEDKRHREVIVIVVIQIKGSRRGRTMFGMGKRAGRLIKNCCHAGLG
jgi:hypothetical protein